MLHVPPSTPKRGAMEHPLPAPLSLWVQRGLLGTQLGHSEPRPGAKQTQIEQEKEMPALMGTPNPQLLSKAHPLSAQSPPCFNCWGAETPMSKSHTQKWPIFAWKKIWAKFFHGGCRGGSKAPRHWKTKQIGPLFLTPHGFNPKYFNPPLGFHGCGVGQRGLGGQGRFMLSCSPFANTDRASAPRQFSGQGTSQLTGSQLGWHCCWHMGNHRSQNHRNP